MHKAKKVYSIMFFSSLLLVGAIVFYWKNSFYGNPLKTLILKGHSFEVEVVSDAKGRERGLSRRNALCESCGMLFEFEQLGVYSFWMHDTKIPLDMLWIANNKVVYIKQDATPYSEELINPGVLADLALEVPAGTVGKLNISIGDTVIY